MSDPSPTHVRECQVRFTRKKLKVPNPLLGTTLSSARQVAATFAPILADSPRERLIAIHLDGRNQLSSYEVVSIGTTTSSLCHPREVFLAAILGNASALILAHCHPSAQVSPSQEDCDITERIGAVGQLVGIRLLDHIILGGSDYFSFLESGRMPGLRP